MPYAKSSSTVRTMAKTEAVGRGVPPCNVWGPRVGAIIALIGGLLLGPSSAVADDRKANPGQTADSLSAAAIAFQLRYGSGPTSSVDTPPRDRWLARDKATHVVVSGLWTLSTQYVLVNKVGWSEPDALPASIASGAAVGLAKEFYDASHPEGSVSGKDLVADAVGIGLAVGVIML
jgi:uncharacterized protein YfiM (DUF2279 family)